MSFTSDPNGQQVLRRDSRPAGDLLPEAANPVSDQVQADHRPTAGPADLRRILVDHLLAAKALGRPEPTVLAHHPAAGPEDLAAVSVPKN